MEAFLILFLDWILVFISYEALIRYIRRNRLKREKEQEEAEDRRRQQIIDEEFTRRSFYDQAMGRIHAVRMENRKRLKSERVNWREEGF